MDIRIAGIERESVVDGVGVRYTVFVQGCPHHCRGCHNRHTWDYNGGRVVDTEDLIREFSDDPLISGITLSGGEPFEQARACIHLANAAHSRGLDVWCYTGYTLEHLVNSGHGLWLILLNAIDVLVDGEFHSDEKSLDLTFRGSTNQRIIYLNERKDKT